MVLVCVSARSVESDKWELIGTSPAVSLEKFVICVCERAEETEAWNWAMQCTDWLKHHQVLAASCFSYSTNALAMEAL